MSNWKKIGGIDRKSIFQNVNVPILTSSGNMVVENISANTVNATTELRVGTLSFTSNELLLDKISIFGSFKQFGNKLQLVYRNNLPQTLKTLLDSGGQPGNTGGVSTDRVLRSALEHDTDDVLAINKHNADVTMNSQAIKSFYTGGVKIYSGTNDAGNSDVNDKIELIGSTNIYGNNIDISGNLTNNQIQVTGKKINMKGYNVTSSLRDDDINIQSNRIKIHQDTATNNNFIDMSNNYINITSDELKLTSTNDNTSNLPLKRYIKIDRNGMVFNYSDTDYIPDYSSNEAKKSAKNIIFNGDLTVTGRAFLTIASTDTTYLSANEGVKNNVTYFSHDVSGNPLTLKLGLQEVNSAIDNTEANNFRNSTYLTVDGKSQFFNTLLLRNSRTIDWDGSSATTDTTNTRTGFSSNDGNSYIWSGSGNYNTFSIESTIFNKTESTVGNGVTIKNLTINASGNVSSITSNSSGTGYTPGDRLVVKVTTNLNGNNTIRELGNYIIANSDLSSGVFNAGSFNNTLPTNNNNIPDGTYVVISTTTSGSGNGVIITQAIIDSSGALSSFTINSGSNYANSDTIELNIDGTNYDTNDFVINASGDLTGTGFGSTDITYLLGTTFTINNSQGSGGSVGSGVIIDRVEVNSSGEIVSFVVTGAGSNYVAGNMFTVTITPSGGSAVQYGTYTVLSSDLASGGFNNGKITVAANLTTTGTSLAPGIYTSQAKLTTSGTVLSAGTYKGATFTTTTESGGSGLLIDEVVVTGNNIQSFTTTQSGTGYAAGDFLIIEVFDGSTIKPFGVYIIQSADINTSTGVFNSQKITTNLPANIYGVSNGTYKRSSGMIITNFVITNSNIVSMDVIASGSNYTADERVAIFIDNKISGFYTIQPAVLSGNSFISKSYNSTDLSTMARTAAAVQEVVISSASITSISITGGSNYVNGDVITISITSGGSATALGTYTVTNNDIDSNGVFKSELTSGGGFTANQYLNGIMPTNPNNIANGTYTSAITVATNGSGSSASVSEVVIKETKVISIKMAVGGSGYLAGNTLTISITPSGGSSTALGAYTITGKLTGIMPINPNNLSDGTYNSSGYSFSVALTKPGGLDDGTYINKTAKQTFIHTNQLNFSTTSSEISNQPSTFPSTNMVITPSGNIGVGQNVNIPSKLLSIGYNNSGFSKGTNNSLILSSQDNVVFTADNSGFLKFGKSIGTDVVSNNSTVSSRISQITEALGTATTKPIGFETSGGLQLLQSANTSYNLITVSSTGGSGAIVSQVVIASGNVSSVTMKSSGTGYSASNTITISITIDDNNTTKQLGAYTIVANDLTGVAFKSGNLTGTMPTNSNSIPDGTYNHRNAPTGVRIYGSSTTSGGGVSMELVKPSTSTMSNAAINRYEGISTEVFKLTQESDHTKLLLGNTTQDVKLSIPAQSTTNGNGKDLYIDAGTKNGSGSDGTIFIGKSNTSKVEISNFSTAEIDLNNVPSAVNNFQISDASTGTGPMIESTGTDNSIDMELITKSYDYASSNYGKFKFRTKQNNITLNTVVGSGSGAEISNVTTNSSQLTSFTISKGGSGYDNGNTITVNNTGTNGSGAEISSVTTNASQLTSFTISKGGSGYNDVVVTVTTETGSGSGAEVSSIVTSASQLTSFTISKGGSGYTDNDTISIVVSIQGGATTTYGPYTIVNADHSSGILNTTTISGLTLPVSAGSAQSAGTYNVDSIHITVNSTTYGPYIISSSNLNTASDGSNSALDGNISGLTLPVITGTALSAGTYDLDSISITINSTTYGPYIIASGNRSSGILNTTFIDALSLPLLSGTALSAGSYDVYKAFSFLNEDGLTLFNKSNSSRILLQPATGSYNIQTITLPSTTGTVCVSAGSGLALSATGQMTLSLNAGAGTIGTSNQLLTASGSLKVTEKFETVGDTITLPANASYDAHKIACGAITEFNGTSTHALITGLHITPPTITNDASDTATVTNASTLYISGAPTATTGNNYSLLVAGGNTKLGGDLTVTGTLTLSSGFGIPSGGTGATSANAARASTNLNAQRLDKNLSAISSVLQDGNPGGIGDAGANKIIRYTSTTAADFLDFKDEDNLGSDSAAAIPSQQSVKAYVDNKKPATAVLADKSIAVKTTVDVTNSAFYIPYVVSSTGVDNAELKIGSKLSFNPSSSTLSTGTGNPFILNSGTDITLNATNNNILLNAGGNTFGSLSKATGSNNLIIKSGGTTVASFSGTTTTLAGSLILGSPLLVTQGGTGGNSVGTARTNLGLGTGDSPQFTSVSITTQGSNANDVTRKGYVDGVAQGLSIHAPVALASHKHDNSAYSQVSTFNEWRVKDGSLNATYNNGSSGVGATLTANFPGNFGKINWDGSSLTGLDGTQEQLETGDRVLIKNQSNTTPNGSAAHNGIYTITRMGGYNTTNHKFISLFIDPSPQSTGYATKQSFNGTLTDGSDQITNVQTVTGPSLIVGQKLDHIDIPSSTIISTITGDVNSGTGVITMTDTNGTPVNLSISSSPLTTTSTGGIGGILIQANATNTQSGGKIDSVTIPPSGNQLSQVVFNEGSGGTGSGSGYSAGDFIYIIVGDDGGDRLFVPFLIPSTNINSGKLTGTVSFSTPLDLAGGGFSKSSQVTSTFASGTHNRDTATNSFWQLTRATDADENTSGELHCAYVLIEDGFQANSGFIEDGTISSGTIGTTPVNFIQFSGSESIVAGDGINKTATTIKIDEKSNGGLVIESSKLAVDLGASAITGTLAIGDGGTGATSANAARGSTKLNAQRLDPNLSAISSLGQDGTAGGLGAASANKIIKYTSSTAASFLNFNPGTGTTGGSALATTSNDKIPSEKVVADFITNTATAKSSTKVVTAQDTATNSYRPLTFIDATAPAGAGTSGDDIKVDPDLTWNPNLGQLRFGSNYTFKATGNSIVNQDLQTSASPTFAAVKVSSVDGIHIYDGSHYLKLKTAADLSGSDKTLTFTTGNADRGITLGGDLTTQNNNVTINAAGTARTFTMNNNFIIGSGNDGTLTFGASGKTLTVSETCTIDQNLQITAAPTFSSLGLEGATAYLTLKNSTNENGDGGAETRIIFKDHDNNVLTQIQGSHDGTIDDSKGDLRLSTNNGSGLSERMRINSAGNVGIGTITPASKLDVNGSIRGAYNSNTTSFFGRAAIGYTGLNDFATFAHVDYNTVDNYALGQNANGATFINTPAGADIAFRIGNTTKMIMNSAENVGIGTTAPASKLDVNGSIRGAYDSDTMSFFGHTAIGGNPNGLTNHAYISHIDQQAANSYAIRQNFNGATNVNAASGQHLNLRINNTTKFHLNSNGNVGIGTGHSAGCPLHVYSGTSSNSALVAKISAGSAVGNNAFLGFGTGSNTSFTKAAIGYERTSTTNERGSLGFYINNDNNENTVTDNDLKMIVLPNGNVGIGGTTPETPLHIKKAGTGPNGQVLRVSRTDPGSCWLDLECNSNNTTTDPTNPRQLWSIATHPNGNLNFYKRDGIGANNYRMSIQGTGNVGIGTTSPNQKLQVDGNIYLGPNDQNSFIHSGATMGLSADGHVKIVADANDISGAAAGGDIIFGAGSNVDMNANESTSFPSSYPRNELMRIKGSGNVGIGTTSPSEKLVVNGNIKASSFITTSDSRHKENIYNLENSLEKICSIRGVNFNFKDDENQKHAGILAQEVDSVIPEAINKKDDEKWSVNYNTFIGYLIESVKTLKKENDNQNVKIENLESRLAAAGI